MIKPKEIFALSVILFFLCSLIEARGAAFAQTSASQIERTQEMTQNEEVLRNKIEEPKKSFIKTIIVQGASLLSKDQIKEIVLPFQNRWLSKDDIQEIMRSLSAAYGQKGYQNQPAGISYEVKKNSLIISIKEI